MKKTYPLNPHDFETSLLFWIRLFMRHKMITLSTRLVYDSKAYNSYVNEILDIKSMADLHNFYHKLIKINFHNLSPYYFALQKLYAYLLMPLKRLIEWLF